MNTIKDSKGKVGIVMNTKEMALLAVNALEDKKAEDVRIIDISEISTIADYFIIADGSNKSQIQAMADNVSEILGRAGVNLRQMEGYQNANWILMDFQDVIVHIFDRENRLFYDLEPALFCLWNSYVITLSVSYALFDSAILPFVYI